MNRIRILACATLIASCSSWKVVDSSNKCFPVMFDHIYFKVDPLTFKEIGKSEVFSSNEFSFFEPHKKPRKTYEGHYITGQQHYLEILSENDNFAKQPIGIGFLSEEVGCINVIEKALKKVSPFKRVPNRTWGAFMDMQTPNFWFWVFEPASDDSGKGKKLSRYNYLKEIRRKNGDTKEKYNFKEIGQIRILLPEPEIKTASSILKALGWKKFKSNIYFAKDTVIVFIPSKRKEKLEPRLVSIRLKADVNLNHKMNQSLGALDLQVQSSTLLIKNNIPTAK